MGDGKKKKRKDLTARGKTRKGTKMFQRRGPTVHATLKRPGEKEVRMPARKGWLWAERRGAEQGENMRPSGKNTEFPPPKKDCPRREAHRWTEPACLGRGRTGEGPVPTASGPFFKGRYINRN